MSEFVYFASKPDACPFCGGKTVNIVYGEPDEETMQLAEEEKVVLGGCCITEEDPAWACLSCKADFYLEQEA